ncbi:MAG TPA: DUF1990 domain-containing protein [Marmoricola sp.]|nr:DUF1990 domain-containing protein [Marmoricola sp.]
MPDRLTPAAAERLRELHPTYDEVGATLGDLPIGYHHLESRTVLQGDLDDLGAQLMRWQVQRGAGLRVEASSDVVDEGVVAIIRLGVGPLALRAPVRVVHVVDEPDRRGFAYGTLPGHPESGEELFLLERTDREVVLVIRAFSRPASVLARLGGQVSRWVQRRITRRYERALG